MDAIPVLREQKRACGYRQQGGLYIVSHGPSAVCGRLPLPCAVCPTCHSGIKAARGWTWVNVPALVASAPACEADAWLCTQCPLHPTIERAGLLWVGERFYQSPTDFVRETRAMGLSRRIPAVPKGFIVGDTWVLLAHRRTIMAVTPEGEVTYTPGIFQAVRPERLEYVVKGTETDEEIARLRQRGITPVKVDRAEATEVALPLDAVPVP